MLKQNRIFLAISLFLAYSSVYAMVYDNRFLPLIQHPFITAPGRPSHYAINAFIITGSSAFGLDKDTEVSYVALFGPYHQRQIGCALTAIGKTDPLEELPFDVDKNLVWVADSKLQAQGFNLEFQQALTCWLSIGFDCLFMRVNGNQDFHFQPEESTRLSPENILILDGLRKVMNSQLGISDEHSSQAGFGDIDAYFRFRTAWDYLYKFRRIETSLRVGVLIPTGQTRNINQPTSVPFGGDGHWGIYGSGDAEFEVKEDWKVGLLLRLSKRFSRTCNQRLPVCQEPLLYGAVIAPVRVTPGLTIVFQPYVSFENLREGLGMRVLYTLRHHSRDRWCVQCNTTVPVRLNDACDRTEWGSDYITLNAFYDFGKVKVYRQFDPIVSLAWDIPVSLLVSRGATKEQKITLGVEFNF